MKIYILIDRSGSMAPRWAESIGAVNGYAEALSKEKATKKSEILVAVFDSQDPFEVVRQGVKASEWKPIAATEVTPRGMTPLYDAINNLSIRVKQDNAKQATIVIVTDGDENHSREIDKAGAKKLLDDMREKGYDVVFIGADFDSFNQGAGLGNAKDHILKMSSGNYSSALFAMASKTSDYATKGFTRGFTDQERSAAVGGKE